MGRLEELRARAAKAKTAEAAPPPKPKVDPGWRVGDLTSHENKVWRVGHVSDLRMRLDPITAKQVKSIDHTLNDYGGSINVSPSSVLDRADPDKMTDADRRREANLISRGEVTGQVVDSDKDNGNGTIKGGKMETAVVAAPPSGAQKANKERLAKLRAKNEATKLGTPKPTKAAAKSTNGSGESSLKDCACGCGEQVKGYFYQGHDARLKGWLLKVERGQMAVKDLPKSVQSGYEWKKRGEGFVPTKNYKGEKHTGYDRVNS